MASTHPYSRSYKTKREQYEEKLKQRNENEEWIFGNNFGKPGGGAPLRDKNGNVISSLKSVADGNIKRYDPQDFSKGDRNIAVVNHKIYERNNGNITNVISDPFTPFRSYINQFDPNSNTDNNSNINSNNINQNINNINQNPILIPITQDQLNNINYQNNQLNSEEQKREIYLNQFRQNPYLIQTPFGIITQYPIMHPILPLYNQNQNIIQNSNSTNNILPNNNQIEYQRPLTSITQNNNSNNINNNITLNNNSQNILNNSNNSIKNYNTINDNSYIDITGTGNGRTRKFLRKLPESTLFNDNIDPEKIKQDKEKKMDEWKKELLVQINEKKKKEAEEKRKMKEIEKKEDLNIEKYYKKKEKENEKKKQKKNINNQILNEVDRSGSGSMGNILDMSNDLEQVNKSIHSQNNNMILKDIQNNDFTQNNIQTQENMNNNNFNNNFYPNNLNQNIYQTQEDQNFKNYIDRQYHMLNETLNNDIDNEMKRISEEVENNYTPFTRKFLLMNTNSKTTTELSLENEKKLKKIQDLIEERKLVDYILGQRERPPTPKKENEETIDLPVPSYFGINRDSSENKYLGLHSKSSFITKNENIANFIASGRNLNLDNNNQNVGNDLVEKQDITNKYNQIMNEDLDINYIYNKNANSGKATFGTNLRNDEALGGSLNFSKNLDNVSSFIPLNKDRQNINFTNEQKIKFAPGMPENYGKYKDRDMEDLFKDLDKIYELTNKIDVTSKARNISEKYESDLNRKMNENKEQNLFPINENDILSQNENENLNIDKEKASEQKSNTSSKNKNNLDLKFSENSNKSSNYKVNENYERDSNGEKYSNNNELNSNEEKDSNQMNNNNELNSNKEKDSNQINNNNELNSNEGKNSNQQNENEEKELSNSQNFNEEPKEGEMADNNNKNLNNVEQENNEPQSIQINQNNEQGNNEPQSIQINQNNDNKENENALGEEEEYEEVEVEEEVEEN